MTIMLLILSFLYISFLAFIYFRKSHIDSIELAFFSKLIKLNLFGLIVEILLKISCFSLSTSSIITLILTKIYLIYLILFSLYMTNYVYSISVNLDNDNTIDNRNKIIVFLGYLSALVSSVAVCVLPIQFAGKYLDYCYGAANNYLYAYCIVLIFFCLIMMIKHLKNVRLKKYTPMIIFTLGMGAAALVQMFFPNITITTSVESFVLFIMYFTIENPDVKMIEQLNVARDQAEKANNAKSEFLSSMSHEIRTPLNAIVGFSQALSEENLPYQAQEEVKDIVMASETLLDLVNGILDISKIEANKLEIIDTEYNFNNLLNEVVSLTKARVGEKPIDFRYSFSPDLPKYMYGDKMRVKQIILNLLTNAVKYTKHGWIEFKVNCVNKNDVCRLIVSVQDTGIGIKQENVSKLFNKFERLDIEKNNTIEGTGLGLAITKKLLELMGGQIIVQSIYGEGSKFTVAIDQKIVMTPTNPLLERTQELKLNYIDLTNKRILVVDDNVINLRVAIRLLQDYHCIVDTLESGIDCINKIAMGASYDLILIDDMMPKMSGTETFHKLKEFAGFNTPIVALTANAIAGMREKYLNEGFDEYLSKPIDKNELNRVLNKFLG